MEMLKLYVKPLVESMFMGYNSDVRGPWTPLVACSSKVAVWWIRHIFRNSEIGDGISVVHILLYVYLAHQVSYKFSKFNMST